MAHFTSSKYFKLFLIGTYIAVILVMCRYAKKNTYYDLDILFYTACVLESSSSSIEQLHERSYALAKEELGDQKFKLYTDSTKYFRSSIYKSAQNFYSQLPFYRIKPFYVGLLSLGYKFGFSPMFFSMCINLVCYCLIAFILLFYLVKHLGFIKGYTISICIMLLPTFLDATKNNTPDMLAALLNLIAVVLFFSKRMKYLSIIPFCLLVLTRPENIIFVALLSSLCLFFKPAGYSRKFILSLLTCSIFCYACLSVLYSEYSWLLLYKHGNIGFIPDLQNPHAPLTVKEYFLGLRFLPNSVFYSEFFLVVLLVVYPLLQTSDPKNILIIIAYALLASFLVRVFLLPDFSSRYFTGSLLTAVILFFRLQERQEPPAKV